MKNFLIILSILMGFAVFAEVPQSEFTFKTSPTRKIYSTGLRSLPTDSNAPISKKFLEQDGTYPGTRDLRLEFKFTPIKDQKQCGSCVYFACTATFEDEMIMVGKPIPIASPQFIMDRAPWSCSGSVFTNYASALVKAGGIASLADYPYRAADQSPRSVATLYGSVGKPELIDTSPKSIIGAVNYPHEVPITIAASNQFMQLTSGIYNACDSMETNHQVAIVGYDCETSVDAKGNCVFDSNGNLPPGVGYWIVRNSWNTGFGEQGFFRIKMTDRSGRKCNNVAGEAGVIDTGIAPVVKVDGGWSNWSDFTVCVNGQQSHSRTCTNPAPSNGGKDCVGPSSEVKACETPLPPSPNFPWVTALVAAVIGLLLGAVVILLIKK